MNNSKFDPVQDELFPRGLTTLFDGFIYTFSSKPIQQGDLVMHVTDEFSEDGSLMYLICICVQENTDGTVQLRSSELLINAERQRSKRLIFTIPTDLTQPAFSN